MAEIIQTVYRGHIITYSEHTDTWETLVATGKKVVKQSLAEVKRKVDDFEKQESQYKNVKALYSGNRYGFNASSSDFGQPIIITSVAENGDVWITKDGKRTKVDKKVRGVIKAFTVENSNKVEKFKAMMIESERLKKEAEELVKGMQPVFNDQEGEE